MVCAAGTVIIRRAVALCLSYFSVQRQCFYSKLPNFMQKNLIFVFQSKEKLYLCNVFPWRHKSFYCSISHTNLHLERDITSKTKYTLELRTIAQSPTIVYLGQCKARVRVWTGPALSLCPYRCAPPYQTLMREL